MSLAPRFLLRKNGLGISLRPSILSVAGKALSRHAHPNRRFSSLSQPPSESTVSVDVVIIGAGQAGLSVAYHLHRQGNVRYVVIDSNDAPGGAWRHRWPSLTLFSTRKWSSLPGHPMFSSAEEAEGYPTTQEMVWYLEDYEEAMKFNIIRPIEVTRVTRNPSPPSLSPSLPCSHGNLVVETTNRVGGASGRFECKAVVSATGTHSAPVWPRLPGWENFEGIQIHSSQYRHADEFRGKRVVVVGAGNSAAQILAEVSSPGEALSTLWAVDRAPNFLPETMTGKDIFDTVARVRSTKGYVDPEDIPSLDSIIVQPGVREALARGAYDHTVPPLTSFTPKGVQWGDGEGEAEVDAVIWCTGYRAGTAHLEGLGVVRPDSTLHVKAGDLGPGGPGCGPGAGGGGESVSEAGIFAVGYGHWAGVGSGSVPGATMYAAQTAKAVARHLEREKASISASAAWEGEKKGMKDTSQISGVGSLCSEGLWRGGGRRLTPSHNHNSHHHNSSNSNSSAGVYDWRSTPRRKLAA